MASDDRSWRTREASPVQEVMPFLALFGIGAIGLQAYDWYQAGQIAYLAGAGAAVAVGLPVAALVASRFMFNGAVDARISRGEAGPPCVLRTAEDCGIRPVRLGTRPPPIPGPPRRRRVPSLRSPFRPEPSPQVDALAGQSADRTSSTPPNWQGSGTLPGDLDTGPVQRATSRRALPQAEDVSRGCRVGVSAHQARRRRCTCRSRSSHETS